jgi:hypothetical protein
LIVALPAPLFSTWRHLSADFAIEGEVLALDEGKVTTLRAMLCGERLLVGVLTIALPVATCRTTGVRLMIESTRAVIAIIAAAAANKQGYAVVKDLNTKASRSISVSIEDGYVVAHDHAASCKISGQAPGSLFHDGEHRHIEMNISGASVDGFDYATGSYYKAMVSGNAIHLHDEGTSTYHFFEVE